MKVYISKKTLKIRTVPESKDFWIMFLPAFLAMLILSIIQFNL
jgi:hypothetical protein